MLVLKKKYDKLVEDYNFMVDIKNDWKHSYNQMESNNVVLEQRVNRLEKVDDELLDLEIELERTDKVVLQYEKRINELEEQLNELTLK